jgi:Predicted dehydrogenases and related proteins
MKIKNVAVFGTGIMAEEYLKVLKHLGCNVSVIGRDGERAVKLGKKYAFNGYGGGVEALNAIPSESIDCAILASAIESLRDIACACLDKNISNILIEKPGALDHNQLSSIRSHSGASTSIKIAYNRRFYNSVILLKKKIAEDGGAVGCFFDFTDREKDIVGSLKSDLVKRYWGFSNSSHVIDTAFYLIGNPELILCERSGSWDIHPTGTRFVGHGKTGMCIFSYFATWDGGGRWSIDVSTRLGRYRLCPLEQLQFCPKNTFEWRQIDLPDSDDSSFKPGLYKMVRSFLYEKGAPDLPALDEQLLFSRTIDKIFKYED